MSKLATDSRLPLYCQLAETLRKQVVSGSLRPGDRLPSESELTELYELSEGTVRRALGMLVEEELLERQHGRGTFVRRPSFDRSLFRFFRFRSPEGEVTIPESRILSRRLEPAPSYVARKLSISPNAKAICISRLRLINDQPMLAEEIWLPVARFRPLLKLEIEEIGPLLYPLYDAKCGQLVASAEEMLTAEMADEAIARPLRLKLPAPLIVIERLARSYDGTPLEWRRSRGPAEHFNYHTEIR